MDALPRPRRLQILPVITVLAWMLVAGIALCMVVRTSTSDYSPDSWAFVDISRSLYERNRGLGQILSARDFVNVPWQNDSFPFLWPLVLAPGIAAAGPSAPVGGMIFVLIWLTTTGVMFLTVRALRLPQLLGPVLGVALLALPGYADEGHAGRSIPLTVLLLASSLLVLLRFRQARWMPVSLGVLLGLCAANRFDSLLYGPVFITLALLWRYLTRRGAILAGLGWVVFPMLWVGYSLTNLGGVYVTDNARVLRSPVPTSVTDWPDAVGRGDPGVVAVFAKAASNADVLIRSMTRAYEPWALAAAVAVVAAAALSWRYRDRVSVPLVGSGCETTGDGFRRWSWFVCALAVLLTLVQVALLLVTGYGDERYWGISALLVLEVIVALIADFGMMSSQGGVRGKHLRQSVVIGLLILPCVLAVNGVMTVAREYRYAGDQGASDAAVVACLRRLQGTAIIPGPGWEWARIPATTNLRAALAPDNAVNLTAEDWSNLRAKYGITSWLSIRSHSAKTTMPHNAVGVFEQVGCPRY